MPAVPCLAYAIVANSGQSIHNGATLVDSYRSGLGAYGGNNRFSHGAVRAGTQIVLNGNANIQGTQSANSPAGLTPMPTPVAYTDLGDLNINGDYTFMAGDYLVNSLNVNGSPKVRVQGGRVRIWFRALNLAGQVGFGGSLPDDLWFFSRNDAWHVNINGSCRVTGVVFAPNVPVNHSGTQGVYGALVGSSVTLNGNVAVHFDEDLAESCAGGSAGGALAARVGQGPKDTPAWALPEGRDLMVGPNPAGNRATVLYRSGPTRRILLRLIGLNGDLIQTLVLPASDGIGQVRLDLSSVAPGIYFAVLQTDAGEGLANQAVFKLAVLK